MKTEPSPWEETGKQRRQRHLTHGTARHRGHQMTEQHEWNTVLLYPARTESVPLVAGERESRISRSDFNKGVMLWRWEAVQKKQAIFKSQAKCLKKTF